MSSQTEMKMEQTQNDCCVCFEELGKTNITTTPCGHSFCFSCIMKCMDVKNSCPYCRTPLREESDIIESDDESEFSEMSEIFHEEEEEEENPHHWVLDWSDMTGLDKTNNPSYNLTTVDEIMDFTQKNNITMRDLVAATFWRYDRTDDVRDISNKSKELSKFIKNREIEKQTQWDERQEMMGEDLRRNNRNISYIEEDNMDCCLEFLFNRETENESPTLSLIHPDELEETKTTLTPITTPIKNRPTLSLIHPDELEVITPISYSENSRVPYTRF